jgi:hypothetical protein
MKKTFYIVLCMLLGVVLLLIIQRALVAIYIIGVDYYPAYDAFTAAQFQVLNFGTVILAVAVGVIYGNYLGHHWYPLVYKDKTGKSRPAPTPASRAPQQKTVTVKPVRVARNKVSLKSEVRDHGWDFDDLINRDLPAVESLSSAAPAVASAVSLGEPTKKIKRAPARKPKKTIVRVAARKPAAKTRAKVKVKA